MSAIHDDLTRRLRLAADYIGEHGWTRGTEQDANGPDDADLLAEVTA